MNSCWDFAIRWYRRKYRFNPDEVKEYYYLETQGYWDYRENACEQLIYRIIFLELAYPDLPSGLPSGNISDMMDSFSTMRSLRKHRLMLFDPWEYAFFGLLDALKEVQWMLDQPKEFQTQRGGFLSEEERKSVLIAAILALPGGQEALELSGFAPADVSR